MDNEISIIELQETASTNTFLTNYTPATPSPITVVTTEYQTAGRGQGTNTWESERGKNLLFSIMVHPAALPVTHAFAISEAIALSIRDAITSLIDELRFFKCQASPLDERMSDNCRMMNTGCNSYSSIINNKSSIKVKWPNDIYVDNYKIAGILIENILQGQHIRRSIIGCGVDVNQEEWHQSSIIKPISLRQLLGHDVERRKVLDTILKLFGCRYEAIQHGDFDALHAEYLAALYRRTGLHPYREAAADAPVFLAEIADVEPSGHLLLRDANGHLRRYAFKEVMYIQDL